MKRDLIIGFDVSKKRIGVGIINNHTGACISAHIWHTTQPGLELAQRIELVDNLVNDLLTDHVIAVFLEDSFLVRHTGMLDSILALGNIEALAALHWPERLVERLKPTTWRRTLGLQMRGKDDPLFYAREHFHTDTNQHLANHLNTNPDKHKTSGEQDAADALCIALAGRHLLWRGGVE